MPSSPLADAPIPVVQAAARLLAEGRPAEAAVRLQALAAAAPAYPAVHVLLARALEAAGRSDEALEVWHRAHFLAPNSPLVQRERRRFLDGFMPSPPGAAVAVEAPTEPEPALRTDFPDQSREDEEEGGLPIGEPPRNRRSDFPEAEASEAEASEAEAFEPEPEGAWHEPLAAPPAPDVFEEASGEAAPTSEVEETRDEIASEETSAPTVASDVPGAETAFAHTDGPEEGAPTSEEETRGEERPEAEAAVAPPDPGAAPGEPVGTDAEDEAAWWRRDAEPPQDAPEEDTGGWVLLEESEAPPAASGSAEPEIAVPGTPPSGEPPAPDAAPEEEEADRADPKDVSLAEDDVEPPPGAAHEDPPTALADELDLLIRRLEDAPRIRPDAGFSGPAEAPFDEGIADDMVSETLARIYAAQKQYAEAAIVYEKLAQQRPEQAEELLRRADEMRRQGRG